MPKRKNKETESLKQALLDEMEELSEDAYAASWMSGIEFEAWRLVEGLGSSRYGMVDPSAEQLGRIRTLRDTLKLWPFGYGDKREWLTLDAFSPRFAEWYREYKQLMTAGRERLQALPIDETDLAVLRSVARQKFDIGTFPSVRKLEAHGLLIYTDWTIFSAVPTEEGWTALEGASNSPRYASSRQGGDAADGVDDGRMTVGLREEEAILRHLRGEDAAAPGSDEDAGGGQ
jgi:hypothetical protein